MSLAEERPGEAGLFASAPIPARTTIGLYEGARTAARPPPPPPAGAPLRLADHLAIPPTHSRPAYWVRGTGLLARARAGEPPEANLQVMRARGSREGMGFLFRTTRKVARGEELVVDLADVVY
eukprot:tig00000492_g1453.t1